MFQRLYKAIGAHDSSPHITHAQLCDVLKETVFLIAELVGMDASASAHESVGKLARRFGKTPYTVGQLLKKYKVVGRTVAGGKSREYPIATFRAILEKESGK